MKDFIGNWSWRKILAVLLCVAGLYAMLVGFSLYRELHPTPTPIPSEARDALGNLEKVQAATQTGINLMAYQALLIEAKASVNRASSILPDVQPGEGYAPNTRLRYIKASLNSATEFYLDALTAWREGLAGNKKLGATDAGRKLLLKYNLGESADSNEVLQNLWGNASARVDDVRSYMADPK